MPATEKEPLRLSISCSQQVKLAMGERADCFLSISGVTVETTDAEIDEMLDRGKIVFSKIAQRIRAKVTEIRTQGGQ